MQISKKLPLNMVPIHEALSIVVPEKTHLIDRVKVTISMEIKNGRLKPKLFEEASGLLPLARDFVESSDFQKIFESSSGWTLRAQASSYQKEDVSEKSGLTDTPSLFGGKVYSRIDGYVVIEISQLERLRESLKAAFDFDAQMEPEITYYNSLPLEKKKWVNEAREFVLGLSDEDRDKLTRKNSGINQTKIAEQVKKNLHEAAERETIRETLNKTSSIWQ